MLFIKFIYKLHVSWNYRFYFFFTDVYTNRALTFTLNVCTVSSKKFTFISTSFECNFFIKCDGFLLSSIFTVRVWKFSVLNSKTLEKFCDGWCCVFFFLVYLIPAINEWIMSQIFVNKVFGSIDYTSGSRTYDGYV